MFKANILGKILSMDYLPPPPPPPPSPQRKSRKLIIAAAAVLIAILLVSMVVFSGIIKFNPDPQPTTTPYPTNGPSTNPTSQPNTSQPNTNTVSISTASKTKVADQTIGSSGGTITVNDGSPLNGLKIEVPVAAISEPITFQVSYSEVTNVNGLPQGTSPASKMISIQATGSADFNQYEMFDKPVKVTLPYDSTNPNEDSSPVRFYWYDSQTGKLDSTGFLNEDKSAHTITFLTGSFSDFIAVEVDIALSQLAGETNYTVDTGFLPLTNGWFIPNYGSVQSPGGNCLGMVSYAKWYYTYHTGDQGLYSKYNEGDRAEWRDDATAIQLATRAHLATTGIWNSLTQEEKGWAVANAREVGLSWLSGMIVTGEPQLIGLKATNVNGEWLNYAHAVMTYGYTDGAFQIYDPNFPGSSPGDSMREIPFNYSTGFKENYISGTTRADSLSFNIFYHAAAKLAATPSNYEGLYQSANSKFQGSSTFPTVTITDTTTTPTGTTPTDTDSDGIRDTAAIKTTISGTITGGQDTINSTLVYVNNKKYQAPVVDGEFSLEVPLLTGDNNIAILATDKNTFSRWAGFLKETIKCTGSPAALTVTLTWDQDTSDVDLHVLEPGTNGRHIYYQNEGSDTGTTPYLDLDNTHGFGPEHYYAKYGSTLPAANSLYGTYQIGVQYYADHSGQDTPQTVTWHLHLKYLAYQNMQTGQEYWIEETRDGVLSTPSSSNTDSFNSGSGWSSIWTIQYTPPDPTDFSIPPPPQNHFPT